MVSVMMAVCGRLGKTGCLLPERVIMPRRGLKTPPEVSVEAGGVVAGHGEGARIFLSSKLLFI